MKNLRVAIADANPDTMDRLQDMVEAEGFIVVGRADNGEDAYRMIISTNPDVVLLDTILPRMDGISVMDQVRKNPTLKKTPEFIVVTAAGNERVMTDAFRNGASYYIMKPFSRSTLIDYIRRLNQAPQKPNSNIRSIKPYLDRKEFQQQSLEDDVTRMLHEIGIPANLKGYQYIRDGILMTLEDREMMVSVTKVLYPAIAKLHKTTASRVERAIRNAIEVAWSRGQLDAQTELFGYTISTGRGKPTNSEFIALIVDKLQLVYKKAS